MYRRRGRCGRASRLLQVVTDLAGEPASRPVTADTTGPKSARDILDLADRLAADLRPGERLVAVADEYTVVLASLLAALQVGGSVALVSPMQREVDVLLERFDSSAVIALPDHPSLARSFVHGDRLQEERVMPTGSGEAERLTLLRIRTRRPLDDGATPLVVLCTSGTVGPPKMVAHTEGSVLAAYRHIRAVWFEMTAPELLEATDNDGSDSIPDFWFGKAASPGVAMTYLSGMPVASVAGFSLGMQALLSDGCIVDRPRYAPDAVLDAVRKHRATSIAVAPITAQMLVRAATHRDVDTSSLIVVGLVS